jgi:hypothetical protein
VGRSATSRPGGPAACSPDLDDDSSLGIVWLPVKLGGDQASLLRRGSTPSTAGSLSLEDGFLPDEIATVDAGVTGWISAELQQNVI